MKIIRLVLSALLSITIFIANITYNSISLQAETLYSKYICLIDSETNRILYSRDENTPVPMASTTKIMTLIIALENCPSDYICTTSSYAASMPDVQLNAFTGEKFTIEDLYYSLMLQSHNDTAEIIAENVAYQYLSKNNIKVDFIDTTSMDSNLLSSIDRDTAIKLRETFAKLMNDKCNELGLSNTYFITPNGLDCEDSISFHHTTAFELAIIMSYCIKNQQFLSITSTKTKNIADIDNKHTYTLNNTNPLLGSFDGIVSGKTGFTSKAGYCYVCFFQKNDVNLILVLLCCGYPPYKNYRWKDVSNIIKSYDKKHTRVNLLDGELCIYIPKNKSQYYIYKLSDNISVLLFDNENVTIDIEANDTEAYMIIKINDKEIIKKTFQKNH